MPELIKIVGKLLIALFQRVTNRIGQREVQRYVSSRERYPSRSSEVSRVIGKTGGTTFVAVRVMLPTKIRFSILFPSALTEYQREHFRQQSWAGYFKDDRFVPELEAKVGYFLPWTDEANGMPQLFAHAWQVARHLPEGLLEMHSDGTYLRVVCALSEQEGRTLDTSKISSLLKELAQQINGLPFSREKRVRVNDRFPLKKWAIMLPLIGGWIAALVALMPQTAYVRSDQALAYAAAAALVPGALCVTLLRGMEWRQRLRWFVFVSVTVGALLIAAWTRVAFELKGTGVAQEWSVSSIGNKRQKYTTVIIGHALEVRGPDNQILSFDVRFATLRGCAVALGDRVRVTMHRDPLGLAFADSAALLCQSPQGPQEIPLLGF